MPDPGPDPPPPAVPSGVGRVARWGAVLTVLGLLAAMVGAGIRASAPERGARPIERFQPLEAGTTWVYRVDDGSGTESFSTVRLVGRGLLADEPGVPVVWISESRTPGETFPSVTYLAERDGDLFAVHARGLGVGQEVEPDDPLVKQPFGPGTSWSYDGDAYGFELSYRGEVTAEDVEVVDRRLEGCRRYRQEALVDFGGGPVPVVTEEWRCPGIGLVRVVQDAPGVGYHQEMDLVAFVGARTSLVSEEAPWPDPRGADEATGGGVGIEPGRSGHIEERVDTTSVAWTDARWAELAGPPVGDGSILVVADVEGLVSATDTATGEVLWRLDLPGRAVASPAVGGEVVVVADGDKRVVGLDLRTGAARWIRTMPDVASGPAAIVDGLALVPFQDRVVRALHLHDGSTAWEADTDGVVTTAPALVGGLAVVAEEGAGLRALSVADGEVVWGAGGSTLEGAGPAVADGLLVVRSSDGRVSGFDALSGEERWTQEHGPANETSPAVSPDGVVIVQGEGTVVGLDREDGTRRWRTRVPGEILEPPLIAGDEVLVVADATLYRMRLSDGEPTGAREIPTPGGDTFPEVAAAMNVVGDRLVVSIDVDGEPSPMVAFPLEGSAEAPAGVAFSSARRRISPPVSSNGPRALPVARAGGILLPGWDGALWDVPLDGRAPITEVLAARAEDPMTAVVDAGEVLLVQRGPELLAIDQDGGPPVWRLLTGDPYPTVAPSVAGQTVVVPLDAGQGLAAVDLASGRVRWELETPGLGKVGPVVSEGVVVHGVGGLRGVDLATGEQRWLHEGEEVFSPPAVGEDGTVYVTVVRPDNTSDLVAVDPRTGRERWASPLDPTLFIGAAVSDGVVVTVDSEGHLRAFDAASGEERWRVGLASRPSGTPAIVDGAVVVVEQGRIEDLREREYRVSAYDLGTGAFLGAYEAFGVGTTLPTSGLVGGRVFLFDSAYAVVLEVRR